MRHVSCVMCHASRHGSCVRLLSRDGRPYHVTGVQIHGSCVMCHASRHGSCVRLLSRDGRPYHVTGVQTHGSCVMRPDSWLMRHASRLMAHASCVMRHASCVMRHAWTHLHSVAIIQSPPPRAGHDDNRNGGHLSICYPYQICAC